MVRLATVIVAPIEDASTVDVSAEVMATANGTGSTAGSHAEMDTPLVPQKPWPVCVARERMGLGVL